MASLDRITIESLDRSADLLFAQHDIDLTGLRYFDPVGAVLIACAAHWKRANGIPSNVAFPESESARQFLRWFGVARILGESSAAQNEIDGRLVDGHDGRRQRLFPSRTFTLTEMKISENLVDFARRGFDEVWLSSVLAESLRVSQRPAARLLHMSAVELPVNVVEHADTSSAFVAAHVFPGTGGRGTWLQMAVGDAGIGVQRSISTRYGSLSPVDAVEAAVGEGGSATGDPARGMGLYMLSRMVRALGGHFSLLSSGGRFDVDENASRARECAWFPGTIVVVGVEV